MSERQTQPPHTKLSRHSVQVTNSLFSSDCLRSLVVPSRDPARAGWALGKKGQYLPLCLKSSPALTESLELQKKIEN